MEVSNPAMKGINHQSSQSKYPYREHSNEALLEEVHSGHPLNTLLTNPVRD